VLCSAEAVPFNVMFESAKAEGPAILVRVHVQAISHPPPEALYCGNSILFEVTRVRGEFVLRRLEESVC